jgi:signal transduction histidine kinase/DNA-binding response OmpR family regulator
MRINWQSLKIRYAAIFTFFIAVILLFNAILLIYFKYKEFQNDVERRAYSFADLAVKPICDSYETYFYSGYFKFREVLTELISSEPEITQVQIVDVNGNVLFDSDDLKRTHFIPHPEQARPVITDSYYLDAIRKLDKSQRRMEDANGDRALEIVSPYIEEWGRHKVSVIFRFTYNTLKPQMRLMIYQVIGLTLLSMIFTSLLAWIFTGRITKPLDHLTEKVRAMISGGGGVEKHLEGSENEVELLANTFNVMTSKIQVNIKQLEANNETLAKLNAELQQLDRMKSDLLANVSHELRTPLTSIKGYTEYILEGKLGEITQKQEKGLMVVQRNLDRLSKLINALLDYSLMDAEKMVLNVKPFHLKLLAQQIAMNLKSELEKRSIDFRVEIAEDLPMVLADKEKIYQVLENLTINAIKFTETHGRITLCAVPFLEDEKPCVQISISDTGVGIPAHALPHIFDRFYQVDATSKRKYGGMGLGLAIARSIVEAHKGTIMVDSKIGSGTTFTVTLPGEMVAPGDDPEISNRETGNYLVEIVDDDPDILRLLRMYLEDEGFRTITAETASKGMALAEEFQPDAIILDVLLPDQDGFMLLEALKSKPETVNIPVVILSIIKEKLKGMQLGAADYLIKPVGHSLLKGTLDRILSRSDRPKTILIVDDEEDTLHLLRDRLKEEGFQTIEANNGKEAIEKATQSAPDLILLDIMMPELTGWDVMESLRRKEGTASIPVVVLSAASSEADRQRGYSMGISNYLTKPFEIKDLISEIKKVIHHTQSHSSQSAPRTQNKI